MIQSSTEGSRKRLTSVFLCLLIVIVAIAVLAPQATYATQPPPPDSCGTGSQQPTYGTANVDGDYSEWNLATDWFADMHEAWKSDKVILSKLYLRYDCSAHVLYVLVLTEDDVTIDASSGPQGKQWVKAASYPYAESDFDGELTPLGFAWVGKNGDVASGWEASYSLNPGWYKIRVHALVTGGRTSGTVDDPCIYLINCFSISGKKFEDKTGYPGLSGWTINLYKQEDSAWSFATSTTTGSDGSYLFTGLDPGAYKVCEVLPSSDWVQTSPTSGTGATGCDGENEAPIGYLVTGSSGEAATGKDFGNFKKSTPSIVTSLSASKVTVGTPVTDSATLSGATSDAGGTIVFKVFSGSDTTCSGTALFTSNAISVSGPDVYGPSTPSFTPSSVGTYRWQAFYSGDLKNSPATSACELEILTVSKKSPSIVTVVSPSTITLGGSPDSATDTATLSGGVNPTGIITFKAYGPSDTPVCTVGEEVFTSTVNVDHGNGDYTSGSFTPSAAGTYWWVASYSGDGNNNAVSTSCGDSGETLVVNKKSPSISTTLSATAVPIGTPVTDTATLSGGADPTGTITFYVYPAGDQTCSLDPLQTFTVNVKGNGDYTSPPFTPTGVGIYQWIASYSGDDNNNPASSACGEESLEVGGSLGTISTTLSATEVTVGTAVTDSATLSGATSDAGGTIVFKVFSGSDTSCSGTVLFTSDAIGVSGNGQYGPSTPSFTPTSVGTYRWQAFYSGDPKNNPATSSCELEILTVNQAGPSIVTLLSASQVPIGTPVTDTATLSDGYSPTGTITFYVYPAGDSSCQLAPISTSVVNVNGNGQYTSDPFTPSGVGVYQWTAEYSGDGNNAGALSACGLESLEVGGGLPSIRTVLSASVITLGQSVWDRVILSDVTPDPGDTVTYNVYNNAYCEGKPVFTSTKIVTSDLVLPDSDPFTPTVVGHYEWQAVYTGLQNHITLTDACGNEPLEVRSGEGQPPVGGDVYTSNKLVLLKPYLTLLGLVGAVATAVAITRGRRP